MKWKPAVSVRHQRQRGERTGSGAKRGPLQRRRRAAFSGEGRRGHDPPPGSQRPSALNSEQDD
ncbi:hypothetical protein ATP96_25245 [Salmonella enterica]|nr:hypothetical protein [Salmonella enterica]